MAKVVCACARVCVYTSIPRSAVCGAGSCWLMLFRALRNDRKVCNRSCCFVLLPALREAHDCSGCLALFRVLREVCKDYDRSC